MTDSLPAATTTQQLKSSPAANTPVRRANCSRTPVEQLLPESVREAVRTAAQEAAEITNDLAAKLDGRLLIAEKYHVSRYRLKSYLHRIAKDSGDKPTEANETKKPAADAEEKWSDSLRAHRLRQVSIAAILEQTFGQFDQSNPALWDRRAYHMLVGLVYERLASPNAELSTSELVALAKVLAQNRHAEARVRDRNIAGDDEDSRSRGNGELPDNFRDIVRQVYGTNFQPPDANKSREDAGSTETDTLRETVAVEEIERPAPEPRDADQEVGGVGG